MNYLLDTNICIYIIKQKPPEVIRRFNSLHGAQVMLSSISVYELFWGIEKNQSGKRNERALENFIAPLEVIDFTEDDARQTARIRAELQRAGTPIGPYDLQIAGIALNHGLTLVTNNTKEFERVKGLRLENWAI